SSVTPASLGLGQETKFASSSEPPTPNLKQQDAIEGILIDLVSQKTGYPRESITLEMRLLDDLNLDFIKAAELITGAAREARMAGKLDASRFATARLEEVAAALRALQPNDSVKNAPDQEQPISPVILSIDPEHSDRTRYPSWVRDFAIELQEEPLLLSPEDRERARAWWVARRCWIISEDAERDLAQAIASYLEDLGARCTAISYHEIVSTNALDEKLEFIALLPSRPGPGTLCERLPKVKGSPRAA
ncbi:MAG: hypothetical protein M3255_05130, partial [Pseudomonadota bacterium]|nr:hypothetical protein [Pseudomonadota bacterium]